jgi:hypothetical protein
VRPVKARVDELRHGLNALFAKRYEARVRSEFRSLALDVLGLGFERDRLRFAARDLVTGDAIENRKESKAADHAEDGVRGALGAAGTTRGAPALVGRDEVDGPHFSISVAASPAAIAKR